jgi:hypothetical protein
MQSVSSWVKVVKISFLLVAIAIACFGLYGVKGFHAEANSTGPPTSFTNAPGENNCTECHSGAPVNSGGGSVQITGLPKNYQAGQVIPVTVRVTMTNQVTYGFQMTVLDGNDLRAGTLANQTGNPLRTQLVNGIVGGQPRTYIEHTLAGIIPQQFNFNTWTFNWTAPNPRRGKITFYAAGNAANSDGNTSGDFIYVSSANTFAGSTTADFDGDNKTDISIFRPNPGQWWIQQSSDNVTKAFAFGVSTDRIVPGDYDGDAKIDVAFWRPSTGEWFVLRSSDLTFFAAPFGASTDTPAPGDFDGDGKTDFVVFRPSIATWFIQFQSGGTAFIPFGIATDIPVVGDYDGDGKSDVAIFRPNGASGGEWWMTRSTDGFFATPFGASTDKPVPADYTGDGKTDVAFFRPSTSEWFILRSEDLSFFAAPFGANGDTPVAGDYDADGKADLAVFRPTTLTWFVLKSSGGTIIQGFGLAGDKPVATAFVP